MILTGIELTNIRSYDHANIELPPQATILFEGDIGSGKSTLLMAVEFALFGLGDQKPQSLLRLGEARGQVILRFRIGDKDYEIGRTLQRDSKKGDIKQVECYLKKDQDLENMSITELKAVIMKLLQFNEPVNPKSKSVIYRYAVFTPQEEMKSILNDTPDSRLQTLRRALQMEDYKTAEHHASGIQKLLDWKMKQRDTIQTQLNEAREHSDQATAAITKLEEELATQNPIKTKVQQQLDVVVREKDTLNTKLMELTRINTQIQGKKEVLESKQKQLGDLDQTFTRLIQRRQSTLTGVQTTEQELIQYTTLKAPSPYPLLKIQQDYNRIKKSEDQKNCMTTELQTHRNTLMSLEREVEELHNFTSEDLKRKIADKKIVLRTLEQKESEKGEEIETITGVIGQLNNKQEELSEVMEQLAKLQNRCPTCTQEITPEIKVSLVKKNEGSMDDIKKKLEFQTVRKKSLQKEKITIQSERKVLIEETSALQAKVATVDRIQTLRKEIEILTKSLQEIQRRLNLTAEYDNIPENLSLSEFLNRLLRAMQEYHAKLDQQKLHYQTLTRFKSDLVLIDTQTVEAQDLQTKLRAEIELLNSGIGQLIQSAAVLDTVKAKYEILQKKQDQLQAYLNEILQKIGQFSGQKGQHIENQKLWAQKITEISKQLEFLVKAAEYTSWISQFFIPTLPKIEQMLMASINARFKENFQKWFAMLVPDETKSATIDEMFTPLITQDGVDQNVDYLSGGERTSVALAYRLSLNSIIQENIVGARSNLLIFDEPTDGFSKDQLFKFRDILDELHCPQIILVSHEKELEGFADTIYFVQKTGGLSVVQQRK